MKYFANYSLFVTEPGPLPTSQPGKLSVSFNPELLPGRKRQLLQHQHGPRELGVHEVRPLPDQGGKLSQLRVNTPSLPPPSSTRLTFTKYYSFEVNAMKKRIENLVKLRLYLETSW